MKVLIKNIIMAGIGGFLGSSLRFLLMHFIGFHSFPYATIIVNILGSFLLGFFTNIFLVGSNTNFYILFSIGFLGAFTTFSTFSSDLVNFIEREAWKMSLVYLVTSIILGVIMFVLGSFLSHKFIN